MKQAKHTTKTPTAPTALNVYAVAKTADNIGVLVTDQKYGSNTAYLFTHEETTRAFEPIETITASNLYDIAFFVVAKDIKLISAKQKGNSSYLDRLYVSTIADITAIKNDDISHIMGDGYDLIARAVECLTPYIGKKLSDKHETETDKKSGEHVDILRATYRAVNRSICAQKRKAIKQIYVDDLNGNAVAVPQKFDLPTYQDAKKVLSLIAQMKLSARESKVLSYRMQGYAVAKIADKMGVKRETIYVYIKRIANKAKEIGLKAD